MKEDNLNAKNVEDMSNIIHAVEVFSDVFYVGELIKQSDSQDSNLSDFILHNVVRITELRPFYHEKCCFFDEFFSVMTLFEHLASCYVMARYRERLEPEITIQSAHVAKTDITELVKKYEEFYKEAEEKHRNPKIKGSNNFDPEYIRNYIDKQHNNPYRGEDRPNYMDIKTMFHSRGRFSSKDYGDDELAQKIIELTDKIRTVKRKTKEYKGNQEYDVHIDENGTQTMTRRDGVITVKVRSVKVNVGCFSFHLQNFADFLAGKVRALELSASYSPANGYGDIISFSDESEEYAELTKAVLGKVFDWDEFKWKRV